MATTYDVILSDGTGAGNRARKDAAIKLGDLQGQPYTVVANPSGKLVHSSEDDVQPTPEAPATEETTPAEAPAPAKPTQKEKPVATKTAPAKEAPAKAEPKKTGPSNELEFTHGAKYFFRPMGESAAGIAEAKGTELALQSGNVLSVSGADAKTRKAVLKEIDQFLTAQYAAFKEWKRTVKDKRAEWYGTPEGRKAMTEAEVKFFNDYATRYLAGEVDEAEGVI